MGGEEGQGWTTRAVEGVEGVEGGLEVVMAILWRRRPVQCVCLPVVVMVVPETIVPVTALVRVRRS